VAVELFLLSEGDEHDSSDSIYGSGYSTGGSNYCTGHFGSIAVVMVVTALAIFDLANLG
jgi:hypothetical protein